MKTMLSRIGGVFMSRSVLFLLSVFLMFAFIGTLSAHADTNLPCDMTATTTSSIMDCVSTIPHTIDTRSVFDEIARIRSSDASTTVPAIPAIPGLGSTTIPTASDLLSLVPTVQDLHTIVETVSSSTGTSTQGLGASIAQAITGGAAGIGTSNIGPFIKCEFLSGIGWPIPTFSSECDTASSTQSTTRIIIVKNTIGADGTFSFSLSGAQSATTSITTSGNSGSVQYIVRPGTFTIAEDLPGTGWTQTGRSCSTNATTTGVLSGALGWQFSITQGDTVTCVFTNVASSTPGGGGGSGGGGGGGNGPIVGGGGFSPGEVLGNSIDLPGVPNTGSGGNAPINIALLCATFVLTMLGIGVLRTTK